MSDTTENRSPSRTAPPVDIRSTSLIILAVIAVVGSLYLARGLFAPLMLGILISYACYPVVSFLRRLFIPRAVSAALVVCLLVAGGWFAFSALQAQAFGLIEKLPTAIEQLKRKFDDDGPGVIGQLREAADKIEEVAGPESGPAATAPGVDEPQRVVVEPEGNRYTGVLLESSIGALVVAGQAFVILLFVYFVLASGDLYKEKLVRVAGSTLAEKKLTVHILDDINAQLRRFFFVILAGAVFVMLLTWPVFWWLGMEEALLWGVIAGIASAIPYAGPAMVFAASGMTAFLQFGELYQALLVAGASLVITSIQGNLLTPWLTSRAASMNAVAVFVSLLFWGWLWGGVGLIVAIPIQMMIKSVCDHVENLRPVGEFLGGR